MDPTTVKITPRIAVEVAQRLRLAAGMRSRGMSALVNDVLDKALLSLEEIGTELAGDAWLLVPVRAGDPGGASGEEEGQLR